MTKPLHVGLNLIYLVPGKVGGLETYARELIPSLLEEAPNLRLTVFLNEEATGAGLAFEGVDCVTVPVRAASRAQWVYGEQALLPGLARRAGVDLVHSLASTAPAWGAFRKLVTIADLHYKVFPSAHEGLRGLGMRILVPLAARRSDRIVAISETTARDLEKFLRVPPGKIEVVYLGIGSVRRSPPTPVAELRERLKLGGRRVLLTMAAKRAHKNLMRLLEALALIPAERRPILILPGYPTAHEEELKARAVELRLEDDTRFLGWVSAEDSEGLYESADAFVFPSLYEGFGLPVLEAMARGVPVACSVRGSLGEVAGDAALVFDPEDPRAIAGAVERLLTDPAESARLREAGKARAARFTWQDTARRTLAIYERMTARGSREA